MKGGKVKAAGGGGRERKDTDTSHTGPVAPSTILHTYHPHTKYISDHSEIHFLEHSSQSQLPVLH